MAEHSAIEWTDATWNPITGCQVVSPGCKDCYAMKLAGTRLKTHPSRAGLTQPSNAGPVWTGEVRFNRQWLSQPLKWRKPRRIFVCAHGDLFADGVKTDWIDEIVAVMALASHHTFQVLTKRPDRMLEYFSDTTRVGLAVGAKLMEAARGNAAAEAAVIDIVNRLTVGTPLPNVWLGTSAENEHWAQVRIPRLLLTPAAVRFVSLEPLLGAIDVTPYVLPVRQWGEGWANNYPLQYPKRPLDWVIAGGENGRRPMHPDWARDIRDKCAEAGVPFFFKQWGSWATVYDRDREDPEWRRCPSDREEPHGRYLNLAGGTGFHGERVVYVRNVGKKAAGRLLDGVEHNEMPRAA